MHEKREHKNKWTIASILTKMDKNEKNVNNTSSSNSNNKDWRKTKSNRLAFILNNDAKISGLSLGDMELHGDK